MQSKAYRARIAASKGRLDDDMRRVIFELHGRPTAEIEEAVNRRCQTCIARGYLVALLSERDSDFSAGVDDATQGREFGARGSFGGHSEERKASYRRGYDAARALRFEEPFR